MNREVHNEHETLDKNEQAVSRLVAGLKHVEAPANFDRRVMGKIADGRPQRRAMFGLPAFAYTVPALLVVLLATFFVFKLRQPSTAQPIPVAVADTIGEPSAAPTVSVTQTPVPELVAQDLPQLAVPVETGRKPIDRARTTSNTNGGPGSYDETVREKKAPMPEGIDPNSRSSANRSEVMTPTTISLNDALDMLGISADSKSQWRVTSVRENSPSAKSGVKVGDVVTALDGKDINGQAGFTNSGSISVITVKRDGKLVPIKVTSH